MSLYVMQVRFRFAVLKICLRWRYLRVLVRYRIQVRMLMAECRWALRWMRLRGWYEEMRLGYMELRRAQPLAPLVLALALAWVLLGPLLLAGHHP